MKNKTRFFLINLTAMTILLFLTVASHGAEVINTNDAGVGSLRAAIATADTSITFNIPSGSPGCTGTVCTITLASTLTVTNTKTIDGSGPNTITIFGNNAVRIFSLTGGGANYTFNALTIRNGAVAGDGAGINFGAGNSLTITNSTIRNNAATGTNRLGGGLFRGNVGGTLTITNSTFNDNTALGTNGQGGGIHIAGGTNNITNSTFSANLATGTNGQGGAIYVANAGPVVTINHGTFTLNSASSGGGIFAAGGTNTLNNTIVAQNTTSGVGPDLNGTFTGSNNLIGNGTGNIGLVNGVNNNQVGIAAMPINAMLAALADNIGPTQTHALAAGSPAVDKAATGLTTDQRGLNRPINMPVANAPNGTGEDIGAFELQIASAAGVSISGRVNISSGGRTIISATNTTTGEIKTAVVSDFGYYQFDEIQAGETYIFQVSNRRYKFTPQVMTILDNIVNLDFSPE